MAIEPSPHIIPFLLQNLELNNFQSRVEVLEVALGAKEEESLLLTMPFRPQSMGAYLSDNGINTLVRRYRGKSQGEVLVKTLDSILLGRHEKVTIIKMDVEGFEYQVLQGAINTIKKDKPILIIEVLTREKFSRVDLYLRSLGYKEGLAVSETESKNYVYYPEH